MRGEQVERMREGERKSERGERANGTKSESRSVWLGPSERHPNALPDFR